MAAAVSKAALGVPQGFTALRNSASNSPPVAAEAGLCRVHAPRSKDTFFQVRWSSGHPTGCHLDDAGSLFSLSSGVSCSELVGVRIPDGHAGSEPCGQRRGKHHRRVYVERAKSGRTVIMSSKLVCGQYMAVTPGSCFLERTCLERRPALGCRKSLLRVSTVAARAGVGHGDIRAAFRQVGSVDFLSIGSAARCAMGKAFSSMILIMKTLQSYALHMRSDIFLEDIHNMVAAVHREVQMSFLWLFQQVFASTPSLMIAVMLLFSNFTAHSTTENMLFLPEAPVSITSASIPGAVASRVLEGPSSNIFPSLHSTGDAGASDASVFPISYGGSFGGKGGYLQTLVGFSDEGDWSRRLSGFGRATATFQEDIQEFPSASHSSPTAAARHWSDVDKTDRTMLWELLQDTVKAMELKEGLGGHVLLDQETIRRLVSPVNMFEDESHLFDRTDLEYQMAIAGDPLNPMLLSNYAQFLYVVRRDNDRAEAFFRRAMEADPSDGDVLGRFASFLWLGRGDKSAAEVAYKAAIASDPSNPYSTGSYAHFMWHCSEDELACTVPESR